MTHLRVLVGTCFLLAIMGFVVSVPLGSGLVLVAAEEVDPLDINAATAEQLKALPGSGDAYPEKIIKGRPYQRKDELVQKKILPRTTHEQIKYKIMAKGGALTVSLSHTASTDANSPITYTLERCMGSGCNNFAGVLSSKSTSVTNAGLAASTSYSYGVRAQAPSGNLFGNFNAATATTQSHSVGGSLSFNASGKAVLNGMQTFLLGISYFDFMNYHTSDIDVLAARGFNTLRVFSNWDPPTYGTARSVCDANGALQTTQRNTMQALINYAKTKNMVVDMVILDVSSGTNMTDDTKRLACITDVVNYFKPTSKQSNWNVLFDVVQEHDSFYPAAEWAGITAQVKPFTDAAKAVCPTCTVFASGTFIDSFIGPNDATSALTATHKTNVSEKIETNAESVLAIHESRSTNWWTITGTRVAAYRTYLASIGRTSTPVFFDEPNRRGGGFVDSSEAEFNTAAAQAKANGAAMWVFHTDAGFDMSALTLFQQLDATEAAITLTMAAALNQSDGTPASLAPTSSIDRP